jgi:hypothetical protein
METCDWLMFVDDVMGAVRAKGYDPAHDVQFVNVGGGAWTTGEHFEHLEAAPACINVHRVGNEAWGNVPRAFVVVLNDGSWIRYVSRANMHPDDRHWLHCKLPRRAAKALPGTSGSAGGSPH